jgi:hypothetical protein
VSLLLSTVFRSVCHSTHHRIAVDALRHLRGPDAERWNDLFLHHYSEYLAGSEAPDLRFKDFRNHVLHVAENGWGGAAQEARRWYGRLVDALRRREWGESAFAAGVLSHYFSDPFMPLHTARSEDDTKVHRAIECSISKSYGRLQQIIERHHGGYPQVETPRSSDWLEQMAHIGAELAHEHYEPLLQHFDLARAAREDLGGMDQECQDRIAHCLAHAVVAFARVLERALGEAEVEPSHTETTLQGFIVAVSAPLRRAAHHMQDLSERMAIDAMFDEAQRSGKVIKNLSEGDREIRRAHAEEVLRMPLHQLDHQPVGITGALHGSGAIERIHPNRLITTPVFPTDAPVSAAWRDAQRRHQERVRGAGLGPAAKKLAA